MNHIIKTTLAALLLSLVVVSCKETAPLSIDPILMNASFTFEPSHGYPGSTVKIIGTGLNDALKVSFGVTEGEIISKSNEEINVKIPVGALTGTIKLVKANSVFSSLDNFIIDVTPIPSIIEFTPAIAGSGDIISINGNLLDMVDSVYIGNLKTTIQPGKTATAMQIKAPASLKSGKIRMFYNYMTSYKMKKVAESVSTTELSLALPLISSITPDISVLNIGDILKIRGLMLNEVTRVQFGTVEAANFTTSGDSLLNVIVPTGAVSGKIQLTIPDGTIQSSKDFAVNLPVITSFFPGKGSEIAGGNRSISLQGSKLDLVQSITVGSTTAIINAQSASIIVLTIPGATSGIIALNSTNGTVKSTVPFIISGDFWVVDNDNIFTPSRLGSQTYDNVTAGTVASTPGGPWGNYTKLSATTIASGDNLARTYWRAPSATGDDLFSLYTADPKGVYFSFDMSYSALPANFINADGSVDIQIFSFTSGDRNPYGYSKIIKVPFTGPEDWKHVSVQLSDLVEDTNLQDGLSPASHTANRVKPNKMRIMSILFPNAPTAVVPIIFNTDNVKFTIN